MPKDLSRSKVTVVVGTDNHVVLDETRLVSWSVDSSYLVFSDGFQLEAYDVDPAKLRGLELQPVEISVNGQQQLLGRVEETEVGGDGGVVVVRGRDYLAQLAEDRVDPAVKVASGMSVADVVKLAAAPQGVTTVVGPIGRRNILTGVTVGNPTAPKDFTAAKLDEFKADQGVSVGEFIDRIVARHGGTVQPGTKRSEVGICVPDFDQEPCASVQRLRTQQKSESNNVVRASTRRNWSKTPSLVVVCGKQGPGTNPGTKTTATFAQVRLKDYAPAALSDLAPEVRDSFVYERPKVGAAPPAVDGAQHFYRLLFQRDEECKNREQMERLANRLMAERLRETLVYSVELRGHTDPKTGAIYAVDTVVDVDDEVCGVRERMWVASRSLSFSRRDGEKTVLELWRLKTFSL